MQKRVKEYDELQQWVNVFNQGKLDIMIVEGNAGTGKSTITRDALKNTDIKEYCWLEGRISAVCLYEKLYEHRDHPIFIDDVDGLYADKQCVNLLKCLCQTSIDKTIAWNTKAIKGIPKDFVTRSHVCIITNSWKSLNKHVGAVQDRGLLLLFHPTAECIHSYVGDELMDSEWFDDDIFIFIGQHLSIVAEPSIRHYRNAKRLKDAGMNWREVLVESFGLSEIEALVLKLIAGTADGQSISYNEQAVRFSAISGKSERTYWRIKADLETKGVV